MTQNDNKGRFQSFLRSQPSRSKLRRRRMQRRPTGTDGSDFSYRMVVDSRYTKVAKGKSRLYALILIQAVLQLIGLLSVDFSSGTKTFAIASFVICLISLLIGEIGRRRSRVGFLRVYIVASCIVAIVSVSAIYIDLALKGNWDLREKMFRLSIGSLDTIVLLLGLPVQIFTISTVLSLIGNMSPPKKAS